MRSSGRKDRRTRQAARLAGVARGDAVTRQRRIGRDDRIDRRGQRNGGDIGQRGIVQIRRDLDKDRRSVDRASRALITLFNKGGKRLRALQVAQFFGVPGEETFTVRKSAEAP